MFEKMVIILIGLNFDEGGFVFPKYMYDVGEAYFVSYNDVYRIFRSESTIPPDSNQEYMASGDRLPSENFLRFSPKVNEYSIFFERAVLGIVHN